MRRWSGLQSCVFRLDLSRRVGSRSAWIAKASAAFQLQRRQRAGGRKSVALVFSFFEDTVKWVQDFLNDELGRRAELSHYRGRMVAVSGSGELAEVSRQQAEAARAREESRRKEAERRLAALERERAEATRQLELVSTGTGFAVTSRGHVVTNNHVVEDCTETRVTPLGMPSVAAPRVFADPNNDLALLVARGLTAETASGRNLTLGALF